MFILKGWRKNGDEKVIAINKDRDFLDKICKMLEPATGLSDPSEGMWDREEIKGRFGIEEIPDLEIKDIVQAGIDFLNYKDYRG